MTFATPEPQSEHLSLILTSDAFILFRSSVVQVENILIKYSLLTIGSYIRQPRVQSWSNKPVNHANRDPNKRVEKHRSNNSSKSNWDKNAFKEYRELTVTLLMMVQEVEHELVRQPQGTPTCHPLRQDRFGQPVARSSEVLLSDLSNQLLVSKSVCWLRSVELIEVAT